MNSAALPCDGIARSCDETIGKGEAWRGETLLRDAKEKQCEVWTSKDSKRGLNERCF